MKETDDIVDGTLSITKADLSKFLDKKSVSQKCTCLDGELHLAIEPDGSPAILKMLDGRDASSEQWFYWLVCDNCCQSRFLSAGMVWMQIRKASEQN